MWLNFKIVNCISVSLPFSLRKFSYSIRQCTLPTAFVLWYNWHLASYRRVLVSFGISNYILARYDCSWVPLIRFPLQHIRLCDCFSAFVFFLLLALLHRTCLNILKLWNEHNRKCFSTKCTIESNDSKIKHSSKYIHRYAATFICIRN